MVFGAGITQADVRFSNVAGDLVATLAGSGETLVILGGVAAGSGAAWIESFEFANGAVLSLDQVRASIVAAQSNAGMDLMDAGDLGTAYTLQPGRGFDYIKLADDATMAFNRGDGIDTVWAGNGTTGARIVFNDLTSAEVTVRVTAVNGADLLLDFTASGDQIILSGARAGTMPPLLQFADGVT